MVPRTTKDHKPRPTFEQDTLTDTEGAAQLLHIPANTLRKWRCTGENNIPFVKIGRQVKYRTSDLLDYIESHTIKG
jgi:excisionase family DNA binding protein